MGDCEKCDRYYRSSHDLRIHREIYHPETYCSRCERDFPHGRARWQHLRGSNLHHLCYGCQLDFDERSDLNRHREEEHHACIPCNFDFDDSDELSQHDVDVHNKCEVCGSFYSSVSNLKNVSLAR